MLLARWLTQFFSVPAIPAISDPLCCFPSQGGIGAGVCDNDNCCEAGSYNTGIAVARSTGNVYVSNECPTGKVLRFTSAGSLVGSPINIGSFPSGINVCSLLLASVLSSVFLSLPWEIRLSGLCTSVNACWSCTERLMQSLQTCRKHRPVSIYHTYASFCWCCRLTRSTICGCPSWCVESTPTLPLHCQSFEFCMHNFALQSRLSFEMHLCVM